MNLVNNRLQLRFDMAVQPAVAQRSDRLEIRAASKLFEALDDSGTNGHLVALPFDIVLNGDFKDPKFSLDFGQTDGAPVATPPPQSKPKGMKTPAAR